MEMINDDDTAIFHGEYTKDGRIRFEIQDGATREPIAYVILSAKKIDALHAFLEQWLVAHPIDD